MVRRGRVPELFWEGGNIGVRVIAGGLLVLLVLPDAHGVSAAGAALATGLTAGGLQLLRLGWITLDHQGAPVPARRWIQKLGVDTVVLGLLWLTFFSLPVALILAAAVYMGLIAGAGSAFRAGRLSVVALYGLFWSAAGRGGWIPPKGLPGRVARHLHEGGYGPADGARATPAAILRRDGPGRFQDGWLIAGGGAPRFLPRAGRGSLPVPLGPRRSGTPIRRHVLTEVELGGPEGDILLMIPAGGPSPEEVGALLGAHENL
jgi:hypothetical protein